MARSMIEDNAPEQRGKGPKPKRYRFELSRLQLSLCCSGLIVALSWMFVFGLLVGRGVPLVDPSDISFPAVFLRFLGLDKSPAKPPSNVAQTWEDQKKMLETLKYYEDLTQKSVSLTAKPTPSHAGATPQLPPKSSPEGPADTKQKTPSTPEGTDMTRGSPAEKTASQQPVPDPGGPETSSEHFTLLISSLRDSENAQRLLDQLKTKGYPARIESLDLSGARWNRVLVGSFQSRADALRYAAEFNRKEKTEGLVIRESR
jgi:cell division septation protein DedD